MRPEMIATLPPVFELLARVVEWHDPGHIQVFITQATVE
jgi:hypothetical protein